MQLSILSAAVLMQILLNCVSRKITLSLRQAQAILDMRLQRLTGLERKKIDDEIYRRYGND